MSHRSTVLAELRRSDRDRQRRKRERMKQLGIPAPHQVDNAISEAVSYALQLAIAGKRGVRAQHAVQVIDFGTVFNTARDILVVRWRFNLEHALVALRARLAKRPEHLNANWTPHLPPELMQFEFGATDMSRGSNGGADDKSGGHVQDQAA